MYKACVGVEPNSFQSPSTWATRSPHSSGVFAFELIHGYKYDILTRPYVLDLASVQPVRLVELRSYTRLHYRN